LGGILSSLNAGAMPLCPAHCGWRTLRTVLRISKATVVGGPVAARMPAHHRQQPGRRLAQAQALSTKRKS